MMDIDIALLGSRIRQVRISKELTSEQLSEIVDLSADSLRHIEIGASRPSLTKLYRIAVALDVSLDYLTGRSPDHSGILIDDQYKDMSLDARQMQLLDKFVSEMVPLIASHL